MMKRKFLSFFLCICLLLSAALTVSAANQPMVMDFADLLSDQEQSALEDTAQGLRSDYEMDVVIVTIDSLAGQSAQMFADGYFDNNDYGYGENKNGVLFLLAMEEREWYISTCGDAIYALTDFDIQQVGEGTVQYLSEEQYYDAFRYYLEALPYYFEAWSKGTPIDGHADYSGDYYHGTKEDTVYFEDDTKPNLFLSLIIGMVAAAISILVMRTSMNTKKRQHSAGDYLESGSFHLRTHQDFFLYSNISKVRRQQNTSSGGGSSVHRSSGGRRHGGGGGKF